MNNKTELRIKSKNIRKSLDVDDISHKIVSQIRSSRGYISAENVMIYYPVNNEISLLELLDDDKTFYLPRVNGEMLEVCSYAKGDKLVVSELHIPEPVNKPVKPSILDIVFVPALCADLSFNRLGYGGGFYDRFLKNTNALKIVILPSELIMSEIPYDDFDVRCDGIISQNAIY